MTDRLLVVEQVVSVATVETPQGPAAAVAVEQTAVATVVAEQGPAGPPGVSAAAPRIYPIAAASSLAATHGLPYAPEAWVIAPDGELIETDIRHAPGVTTAIFPGPFTGTLLLR